MNFKFIKKSQEQLKEMLRDLNREIQKETHPQLIEIQQSLENSINIMNNIRVEQKLNIDVMKDMVRRHSTELIGLFPDVGSEQGFIGLCLETKFTVYVRTNTTITNVNLLRNYPHSDFYEGFYSACFKASDLPFGSVVVKIRSEKCVQVEIKLPKKVDTEEFMNKLRDLSQNIDSFMEKVNSIGDDAIKFINDVSSVHHNIARGYNYHGDANQVIVIRDFEKVKDGQWEWKINNVVYPVKLLDNRIVFYHPEVKEITYGTSHYNLNRTFAAYK